MVKKVKEVKETPKVEKSKVKEEQSDLLNDGDESLTVK
jgi:hypothetical protein